jgi:hypothetical protein
MKVRELTRISSPVLPLLAAASVFFTQEANAATGISLTDSFGDPTKTSISPGDSFIVTLRLSATAEQLIGTTYSIVTSTGAAGKFKLVSRSVVGTLFSDLTAGNISNTTLTEVATVDLGGTVQNLNAPAQPGTLFLADYTILADPTIAPGVYFLQAGTNSIAVDNGFNSLPLSSSSYQVTVIPEPGSAVLAFGGVGVLGGMVRRRRHSASA